MSSTVLRLIPTDPTYVPDPLAQARACDLVRELVPGAEGIEAQTHEETAFIDQGESFESVRCPHCKCDLEMDWWQEAMGTAGESSFENLTVRVPCCSTQTSLNDLDYHLPAGFARFVIEVTEPSLSDFIDPARLIEVERILCCSVRQVLARY